MFYDPKWEKPAVVADEPWRKVLVRAAEVIRERGWTRYELESARGSVCMLGALNMASFGVSEPPSWWTTGVHADPKITLVVEQAQEKLAETLRRHVRKPINGDEDEVSDQISTFNDDRCRSKQRVISLLLEAAAGQ
jgi:hypothetical protein